MTLLKPDSNFISPIVSQEEMQSIKTLSLIFNIQNVIVIFGLQRKHMNTVLYER